MLFRKKPIDVFVHRTSKGDYEISDSFGKKEKLDAKEFARYIELKFTKESNPKPNLDEIKSVIEYMRDRGDNPEIEDQEWDNLLELIERLVGT
jgi:hypothetical protein